MYLKITDGVPEKYSIYQLRRDNPQTSFPKLIPNNILETYNVFPYTLLPYNGFNEDTHKFGDEKFVQDVSGQWALERQIIEIPLNEAQSNVRTRRDNMLLETDWVVVKSYERGEPVPTDWATYRQALRDITAQADFPYNVQWPSKPN